jgi:molybdopterin-guanine dinucleotide biosynthesis protein A
MPLPNPPEPVGVVLAGGRSRRMGRDKADIEWRPGQTLLARAVQRAEAAGCRCVLVSGQRPGFDHVPDLEPGLGPLGGLGSVLRARAREFDGRLLLVVPLDMPVLTAETLRRLVDSVDQSEAGAIYTNGPLPMALRCNAELSRAVRRVLDRGAKRSLGELARALELKLLDSAPEDEMANVNCRDELLAMRRAHAAARTN